ncbi:MAG: lysozyme inhibitor LprI family protein [Chitinivorax sp.]
MKWMFQTCAALLLALSAPAWSGTCDRVQANDELISCLDGEYRQADKELNQVYAKLRGRLDAGGKALLKTAQTRWIGFRDADCEFTASADKGGLDYQPNYIGCQTERTRQRISELKRSPFWRD